MLLKNMKLLCAAVFAAGAMALNAAVPAMSLEYFYDKDGTIIGRSVNGEKFTYSYDKKGQLLSVKSLDGKVAEAYAYDPAGNILSKTIEGKMTSFKYDKANQLVSSTDAKGKVTNYEYDAAGRLVKEGDKEYKYSYLDKIVAVTENGKETASFDYYVNGQIASANYGYNNETFIWDGLKLIQRNDVSYINERSVTGGNPILAGDKVLFNDMLGTTLGVKSNGQIQQTALTSFGESKDGSNNENVFFTGKPHIGELGYSFLFRNYRSDLGKWQTADPMGYPDGWNQLAYCNNWVTSCIDCLGADIYHVADLNSSWHGHSASIVGNSKDGYKAYNYGGEGGGYTVGNPKDTTYQTPQEALAALNKGRAGDLEYEKVQKWTTTPEEDKKAQDAIKNDMEKPYDTTSHNCTDPIEAGLGAAGVKYRTGLMPGSLFSNNKRNATTLNYNDFKNGIVE